MLEPCSVTDVDPVLARLPLRTTLISTTFVDHACDRLPLRSSAVIISLLVPRPACPTRHLTEVSDSHSVDSHAVRPSRAFAV